MSEAEDLHDVVKHHVKRLAKGAFAEWYEGSFPNEQPTSAYGLMQAAFIAGFGTAIGDHDEISALVETAARRQAREEKP